MIVDENEINSKVAKVVGMPTTQVGRVINAYLDVIWDYQQRARKEADPRVSLTEQTSDHPAETTQETPAADAATPTKAPRKRASRAKPTVPDEPTTAQVIHESAG